MFTLRNLKISVCKCIRLILKSFDNNEKTSTMHALLAHGLELIANNDGKGLGEISVSVLENNNKYLR